MKLIKTASGKQLKISKEEWKDIGKQANWQDEQLPMPVYDDIFDIEGAIQKWVEQYMDKYPESEWAEKQTALYKEIAKFCINQAQAINSQG